MGAPQVILNGLDIYDMGYVAQIDNITESKTFQKDKLIQNEYVLNVKNFDNFFSCDNPRSIFYGGQYIYLPLKIYDENGGIIWDGIIEDISRDHTNKTAQIVSRNSLIKYAENKIEYASAGWETPADAIKNILDDYPGLDYDAASLTQSINLLTAAGCTCKVNIDYEDDSQLQVVIEKLAEMGCCDAYSHNNKIYIKHSQTLIGSTSISIGLGDMLTRPKITNLTKDICNEYRMNFYGDSGAPATDAGTGNIGAYSRAKYGTHQLPEMGATDFRSQVCYQNSAAGQYIGEQYIRRGHIDLDNSKCRPKQAIDFSLKYDFQQYIDLQTYFRVTFADEGWTDKLFEVYGFTKSFNERRIDLLAYEVEE